jgi:hypothetical protein
LFVVGVGVLYWVISDFNTLFRKFGDVFIDGFVKKSNFPIDLDSCLRRNDSHLSHYRHTREGGYPEC